MVTPILFKEFQKSEFFEFFNIHAIKTNSKMKRLTPGGFKYFKPGGFLDYVDILFRIDETDLLTGALLILDRTWVGNLNNINPFAVDISKSILNALAPKSRPVEWDEIIKGLSKIHGLKDIVLLLHPEPPETNNFSKNTILFLQTYLNLTIRHEIRFENATLEFENYDDNGKIYFIMDYRINMRMTVW